MLKAADSRRQIVATAAARDALRVLALAAALGAASVGADPALAKTPGEIHCYGGICHRVKSLQETRLMVGRETNEVTSFYDIPERDRHNTGTYTSSGERFDALSDGHAASSHFPDGTELLLWNPKNGHAAHVRINDFGPFYLRRTLDVTVRVAEKLEFNHLGVTTLSVIVIWAPDDGDARYRRRRVYPPVEGFLGQFDRDLLRTLKRRLIREAPARNGQTARVFATPSLVDLPAFADPSEPTGDDVRRALIANAPRYEVTALTPEVIAARVSESAASVELSRPVGASVLAKAPSAPAPVLARVPHTVADSAPARSGPSELLHSSRIALDEPTTPSTSTDSTASSDTSTASTITAAATSTTVPTASLGGGPPPRSGNAAMSSDTLPVLLNAAGIDWNFAQQWLTALGLLLATVFAGWTGWAARRSGLTKATALAGGRPAVERAPLGEVAPPAAPQPAGALATSGQPDLANMRADAARLAGDYDLAGAEQVLRRALDLSRHGLGPHHAGTAMLEADLADCLRDQGRYRAAEPHYQNAVAVLNGALGSTALPIADVLDAYAVSVLRQGRAFDAQSLTRQSLVIRRHMPSAVRASAATRAIEAEALRAGGDLVAAERLHRDVASALEAASGADSLDAASGLACLGTVLSELGQIQAAEQMLNRAVGIIRAACGDDHPYTAGAFALLGDLYTRAQAFEAAEGIHLYVANLRESRLGPNHPDAIESRLTLATLAAALGRYTEAQTLVAGAVAAIPAGERDHLGPQSRVRKMLVALERSVERPVERRST